MDKVIALSEAGDAPTAGGKGAALAVMMNTGFRVPDGFVITTSAVNFDKKLENEVLGAFDNLGAPRVAVRSSAVAEDGLNDAWAGQMDSFLNIDRRGLIEAVQKCWRSARSARAKAYADEKGLLPGRVAVVVQEMIEGDISGVAFSVNPISKDKDEMVIEAVPGLADKLVAGEITPQTYIVDRKGRFINKKLQQYNTLLSDEQRTELSAEVVKLEKYFGFAVDVEWTFKDGELFILQSRPITTLG